METMSITFYQQRKRWKFPEGQFITYEESDESWCRFFGIGEEVEETVTVTIPHAMITEVNCEDRRITFRGEAIYDYYC